MVAAAEVAVGEVVAAVAVTVAVAAAGLVRTTRHSEATVASRADVTGLDSPPWLHA